MITEFAIAGAITYVYDKIRYRKFYKIRNTIKEIMEQQKMECNIKKYEFTEFGYRFIVHLFGIDFNKLKNLREVFQNSMGHFVFIEQNNNICTATINVITKRLDDNIKFKPYSVNANEIYVGLDYKLEHMVIDLRQFPHVLVSGQTGSGKSEILRLILTNAINSNSERDLNIYFSDLSDGNDFDNFAKCKQVKGFARNINDSFNLFEKLTHIYSKRLSIFSKNDCRNIKDYNKKFFKKRMSYIYLVLDEFADFFPSSRLEKDYNKKIQCYNLLKHLVRKSRKAGIFLMIGIQRPDTTVLDPSLRSGLCTKIGFSQNNDASSLTVCDTTELTNIENREALLTYGNKKYWFRSLYLDDNLICKYVKNSEYTKKEWEKINKKNIKEEKVTSIKTKSNNVPKIGGVKTKTNKKNKSKCKVKLNVSNK